MSKGRYIFIDRDDIGSSIFREHRLTADQPALDTRKLVASCYSTLKQWQIAYLNDVEEGGDDAATSEYIQEAFRDSVIYGLATAIAEAVEIGFNVDSMPNKKAGS